MDSDTLTKSTTDKTEITFSKERKAFWSMLFKCFKLCKKEKKS